MLRTLEEVTQTKFGAAGVAAISKYSWLVGAQIDDRFYMVEAGNGLFHIKRLSNDTNMYRICAN